MSVANSCYVMMSIYCLASSLRAARKKIRVGRHCEGVRRCSIFKCGTWWSVVTSLLAIQICGCPHSTMGHDHFSLWTPSQSEFTQANSCLQLTQPCWAAGNPPYHVPHLSPQIDSSLLNVTTAGYHLMFDVIK